MSALRPNPFETGDTITVGGRPIRAQIVSADDRIRAVAGFNSDQCTAALALPDLQKTVRTAVERRQRAVARSAS
jgi:hypothetical protein